MISGSPVISYFDRHNVVVKVAVCGDPACTPGKTTVNIVDEVGPHEAASSVALNAVGDPVIAYFDSTTRDLKLAVWADAVCSPGAVTIVAVD